MKPHSWEQVTLLSSRVAVKGLVNERNVYYDSQLSMTLGKFGDKVSVLKLPFSQGQLTLFPCSRSSLLLSQCQINTKQR